MELLKVLLRHKCEQHEVAPKLIANVADLERIASDKDPQVKALKGWRFEVFGQDALRLKAGEIGLTIEDDGIVLISR